MRAGKGILGCEIHGVGLSFGERRCDESILSWVGYNGASPPGFVSFVLGVYGVMYGIWPSPGMEDGGAEASF